LANERSNVNFVKFRVKSPSESGEYACKAVDLSSKRETVPSSSSVNVYLLSNQTTVQISMPGYTIHPDRIIRVKKSDDVKLQCRLKNNQGNNSQPVKLKWLELSTKKEVPFRFSKNEDEFTLQNIGEEKTGRYYCIAYLGGNKIFDYVDLEVDRFEIIF
jgi:hypothetical protein